MEGITSASLIVEIRVESKIAKLKGVQWDLRVFCIAAPTPRERNSASSQGQMFASRKAARMEGNVSQLQ
jgi:hypothetical protein